MTISIVQDKQYADRVSCPSATRAEHILATAGPGGRSVGAAAATAANKSCQRDQDM